MTPSSAKPSRRPFDHVDADREAEMAVHGVLVPVKAYDDVTMGRHLGPRE